MRTAQRFIAISGVIGEHEGYQRCGGLCEEVITGEVEIGIRRVTPGEKRWCSIVQFAEDGSSGEAKAENTSNRYWFHNE